MPTGPQDQQNKHGITGDYNNELSRLFFALDVSTFDEALKARLAQKGIDGLTFDKVPPLQRYTKRYDASEPWVLTPANHRRVERIDVVVDELNSQLQKKTMDAAVYRALAGRLYFWVNGIYHQKTPRESLAYSWKDHDVPR
jgi:hypothetical protein